LLAATDLAGTDLLITLQRGNVATRQRPLRIPHWIFHTAKFLFPVGESCKSRQTAKLTNRRRQRARYYYYICLVRCVCQSLRPWKNGGAEPF